MKFGPLAVTEAVGALAAHTLKVGGAVVKKGSRITAAAAAELEAAGVTRIVAVRLEEGDVGEDEAALHLARAVAGPNLRVERPFTGRSNLYASRVGVLRVDKVLVDAINGVDESVTLATLPAYKSVVEGEMVATVKIIPYAVPNTVLAAAAGAAGTAGATVLDVAPYRLSRIAAISTLAPGLKPSVVAKTIEAFKARLAAAGASLVSEASVPHDAGELAEALRGVAAGETDLTVVFGASAIADRRDVIPAAIEAAGGEIEHFGMPVDPGNLLLIGRIGAMPVIGAPGCARSPKENGFDWILQRLLAGLEVTRTDIAGLGVGGLLMEIVSRGQPRSGGVPEEDG